MNQSEAIDAWRIVPHAGAMCFLDRAFSLCEDGVSATAQVRSDHPLLIEGCLGPWVGIEYMAQGIAAFAGWRALKRGETVRPLGFLLGTRRYQCERRGFFPGDEITVVVTREMESDDGMGMFSCRLLVNGQASASANLAVFSPPCTT